MTHAYVLNIVLGDSVTNVSPVLARVLNFEEAAQLLGPDLDNVVLETAGDEARSLRTLQRSLSREPNGK